MSALRTYIYGAAPAALRTLLDSPRVVALIERLAAGDGASAAPAEWDPSPAVECGLLVRNGAGLVAGPRLVVVTAAAERACLQAVQPALTTYVRAVEQALPLLREAYSACAAARRFAWPEVEHTLVPGLLMDMGVGQVLDIPGQVLGTHGASVVWAYAQVSADNAYGVRWVHAGEGGLGQLWHAHVPREPVPVSPHMVAQLLDLARGEQPAFSPKDGLYLRYRRLVAGENGAWRLACPSFLAPDARLLAEPVLACAARLRDEAVLPALDACAGDAWWGRMRDEGGYRHAALRLVLEYATDRVVAAGLVQPFPRAEVAPAWGRWLWAEPEGARLAPPDFGGAS